MDLANIMAKLKRKRVWLPLAATLVGIIGGYAYYYFVGCSSGSCPITSSPWGSMLFGGAIGLLLTVK